MLKNNIKNILIISFIIILTSFSIFGIFKSINYINQKNNEIIIALLGKSATGKTSFIYNNGDSPAELRKKMNRADFLSFVNPAKLKALLNDVLALCSDGLKERGYAEGIYLKPLYRRAESLISPAKYLVEHKNQIITVIKKYANLEETL